MQLKANCDLVFTATPHGGSVNLVPKLLEAGLKVIDMSADFRLKNPADYDILLWLDTCSPRNAKRSRLRLA